MRTHWFFAGWTASILLGVFMRGPDALANAAHNIRSWLTLEGLQATPLIVGPIIVIAGVVAFTAWKIEPRKDDPQYKRGTLTVFYRRPNQDLGPYLSKSRRLVDGEYFRIRGDA